MLNRPDNVVLHCSATSDFVEGSENFNLYGAKEIDEWHRARGWDGIGYHFVVRRNGDIEPGRNLQKIGAHTKGHNQDSIGVCWIGTYYPTKYQVKALAVLYRAIKSRFKIDSTKWMGHYEFANKQCPGFSMELFRYFLKLSEKEKEVDRSS